MNAARKKLSGAAAITAGTAAITAGAAVIAGSDTLAGAAFIALGAAFIASGAMTIGPRTIASRVQQAVDWATKAPPAAEQREEPWTSVGMDYPPSPDGRPEGP